MRKWFKNLVCGPDKVQPNIVLNFKRALEKDTQYIIRCNGPLTLENHRRVERILADFAVEGRKFMLIHGDIKLEELSEEYAVIMAEILLKYCATHGKRVMDLVID